MKSVYDWMCLNVDRLVEAVILDGGLFGANCEPFLNEAFNLPAPGRTREKARELLRIKLAAKGIGGLVGP